MKTYPIITLKNLLRHSFVHCDNCSTIEIIWKSTGEVLYNGNAGIDSDLISNEWYVKHIELKCACIVIEIERF